MRFLGQFLRLVMDWLGHTGRRADPKGPISLQANQDESSMNRLSVCSQPLSEAAAGAERTEGKEVFTQQSRESHQSIDRHHAETHPTLPVSWCSSIPLFCCVSSTHLPPPPSSLIFGRLSTAASPNDKISLPAASAPV